MSDRRVFLGWPDPAAKVKPSPVAVPWDGGAHLAVVWDFGAVPHLYVVGTTGGGKSSLLRLVTLGLVRQSGPLDISIIDGEGAGEFMMFTRAPHIATIVNSNEAAYPGSVRQAADLIEVTLAEVLDRNAALTKAQQEAEATRRTPAYNPPGDLIVIVDGWMSLIYDVGYALGGSTPAARNKARVRTVGQVLQIARIGRKVGVHLVLGMHRLDAKSLETGFPGELKLLFGAHVAAVGAFGLRRIEAEMAFDDPTAKDRIPTDEHGNGVPGGCLIQVGATEVPFLVPFMVNPTTADPGVDDAARAAVWRRVPLAVPMIGAAR